MKRNIAGAAIAAAAVLALLGCAPQGHADYGVYESADALAEASTDVVQVTITGSTNETLVSKPFEGTDPETNPYYGAEGERPSEELTSVDVVVFEAAVDLAYKGEEEKGATMQISQLRGDAGVVSLKEGETYVLYLRNVDPDYPAGIVGGSQGQYLLVDGKLVPANSEVGFDLSLDQLSRLE